MKRSLFLLLIALAIVVVSISGFAQDPAMTKGTIVAPPSTRGLPGLKVRTPLYIFVPEGGIKPDAPPPSAENPGSIACIYGVTPPTNGCPRSGSPVATGGSRAIAVVDYGHNSTLQADFNAFNSQYGLPAQTLQFICDCGSCPSSDRTGWDVETALDVEYSHAMAPHAQIIVAQFCNDPFQNGKTAAEWLAGQAVASAGGGEVSNSFGYGGEAGVGQSLEMQWDQLMTVPGVVYSTSAGDSGLGPDYPSVSPNTLSAGGTRVVRDSNGNFTGEEDCWNGSGGGISLYEPLPNYQLIIGNRTGPKRGTPDYSADASPSSPVAIYSTTGCGGWCQVGGTSVSSPVLAGIINAAGKFRQQTPSQQATQYGWYRNPGIYHQYFYDVTKGSNGAQAVPGWDQCTGLGSPRNLNGF
jgi:subtilase family serine protease